MRSLLDLAPLVGRILVGGYFLLNGINSSLDFPGFANKLTQTGFPMPLACVLVIVGIQVLFGIALVAGYKTRVVSLVLAIYTLLISTLSLIQYQAGDELFIFLQSMAIVGGLLIIAGQPLKNR